MMVSSRLSLALPRQLLKSSPKFQLLLALIGHKITSFGFDFQLSGPLKAINFKWLESDFKQQIQKFLPDFIERGIEKNIEDAIWSIAS